MMRSRLLVLSAVLAAAVSAAVVPSTSGAFVAKAPTAAAAATNTAWSCADAVAQEGTAAILAYPFDESSAEANSPGKAVDISGQHRDGTYSGERNKSAARGICYRDTGGFPYVLKGTGGFVSTPSVTLSGAFTLETWFSTSTSTTTTARPQKTGFLFGSGTADVTAPPASAVGLYLTDAGRLVFAVGGGSTSVSTPAGTSYADNAWWHVVATYSTAAGASLYVNGRLIGVSLPATAPALPVGGWRIGATAPAGWPMAPSSGSFSGSLRYAAMYSTALSAAAVAQHAAAGSVPRLSDNAFPDYRG